MNKANVDFCLCVSNAYIIFFSSKINSHYHFDDDYEAKYSKYT